MPQPPTLREDLHRLLAEALDLSDPLDELALLRIALRRYADNGDMEEAITWAATKLSDSLTNR